MSETTTTTTIERGRRFVGTSTRKLDDKGRIVLNTGLRDALGSEGYITRADKCLQIRTPEGFDAYFEELEQRVRATDDARVSADAMAVLSASTETIRADSQGRITLPAPLLAAIGLRQEPGTEVVVNGNNRRIEIWSPDTWERVEEGGTRNLNAVPELGL